MEYQFIRDPLFGFKARFNQEHGLFGRWLTEEVGRERLSELEACVKEAAEGTKEVIFQGKEIRLTLVAGEALLEEHALYHGEPDISVYADDQLAVDENAMMAVCGLDDFIAMLSAWREFVG